MNSRGLNGDTLFLFIFAGIGGPLVPCLVGCDHASLGQQRVRQCGLSMVHMSDDSHVANVSPLPHHLLHLFQGKVHLEMSKSKELIKLKVCHALRTNTNVMYCVSKDKITSEQQLIQSMLYMKAHPFITLLSLLKKK